MPFLNIQQTSSKSDLDSYDTWMAEPITPICELQQVCTVYYYPPLSPFANITYDTMLDLFLRVYLSACLLHFANMSVCLSVCLYYLPVSKLNKCNFKQLLDCGDIIHIG